MMRTYTILLVIPLLLILYWVWPAPSPVPITFPGPKSSGRLEDLSVSAVKILGQLPGVGKIERNGPKSPRARIIHICDWHFVPKNLYEIDVGKLSRAEHERSFQDHLLQVERVQVDQMLLLRELIKHHGLKTVFSEGLSKEGLPSYKERIDIVRDVQGMVNKLEKQLDEVRGLTGNNAKLLEGQVNMALAELKPIILEAGSPGRLLASGELEAVLPLEDEALFKRAKPVVDGKIKPDPVKIQERREAMVLEVMQRGTFGVVVLGGPHDLSKIVPMYGCEYIRVWVANYPK